MSINRPISKTELHKYADMFTRLLAKHKVRREVLRSFKQSNSTKAEYYKSVKSVRELYIVWNEKSKIPNLDAYRTVYEQSKILSYSLEFVMFPKGFDLIYQVHFEWGYLCERAFLTGEFL